MREWLVARVGMHLDVDAFIADGRFVYETGAPVRAGDRYTPNTFVWFHRDLAAEAEVPGELSIVHRDDRLIVIDKPAFLSTIPRGKHVLQSVVVRLRHELGLPELTPMHRLDRVTSGLLVLTTERRWRGAYQSMFQRRGEVRKTYHAVAQLNPALTFPLTVENHLAKQRGTHQAEVVPGAQINARSTIEFERALTAAESAGIGYEAQGLPGELAAQPPVLGRYRLTPHTGRTHQLRMHMWGAGIPITGDPLYPTDLGIEVDDFSTPLQLLASEIAFTDPVSGVERSFTSELNLPLRP
nr:pseudouridine synthase [Leucobacter exalbidus]